MVAGIISTAIIKVFALLMYATRFPKMNPPEMLASTMRMPLMVGYLAHSMIGIIFAAGYVYLSNPKIRVNNKVIKGLLFGLMVMVLAQKLMFIMDTMLPAAMPAENKILLMAGSLIVQLVFGVEVASWVKSYKITHSPGFFGNIPAPSPFSFSAFNCREQYVTLGL